jgi:polar amino acid transport system permease protein
MDAIIENFFNIEVLLRSRHLLLSGLETTLYLVVLIVLFGQGFGLFLAVLRHTNRRYLNPLLIAYVDIVRSIPILVLLMLIYYALPFLGIRFPRFWAATFAMSLNGGAYYAEIFRSGIEAVDKGQIEAARSVGLTYLQTMRYVVLPQAFRIVLPPLTSNTLELIKASAVASVVALPDILKLARQAQSLTLNPSPLVGALILYLILLLPLVQLVSYFERSFPQHV